jgi:hypothetical protein
MNTENGVLEWCTAWCAGVLELWSNGGTRNGMSESWNNDLTHSGGGKAVEKAALEGGWRRVLVENGCAQLHAFTRIYTHLHAFTRIYTHLHAFTRIYTTFFSLTLRAPKSKEGRQVLPGWLWRNHGFGFRVSAFAAFCRLLPPFAAFSRGGVPMVESKVRAKDRLAEAYFRFGKRRNKLLN